jgi:dihydroorotate dehydrogenase
MYPLAKRALFRLDAERAHDWVLGGLRVVGGSLLARRLLHRSYALTDPRLKTHLFGLQFPNPLGVAAGLDKNAVAVPALGALGFGSVEVGSVTALAQPGNPKPRLFRLPEDQALINRMGFNNQGAPRVSRRLALLQAQLADAEGGFARPIVGVNVGKSRVVELADAPADYLAALAAVWPHADYLVINVSSPNTPGLRSLQEATQLQGILEAAAQVRQQGGATGSDKPVLLKLAPDLDAAELADIVSVAESQGVAGLIATNTTLSRQGLRSPHAVEAGGVSGRPVAGPALRVLEILREGSQLPLVAAGGIFSGTDAVDRVMAGADLLQVYTGFIYEGPRIVRQVLGGLLQEMERRGVTRPSALRG